jgi:aspartate/methionine/tyrosine aminotransferase
MTKQREDILSKNSKFVFNPIEEENATADSLIKQGKKIAFLHQGNPPLYFPTPKYIIDAYVKALREGKTGYSNSSGITELKEAIVKRYKRMYHLKADTDSVIVTQGVSEAIRFLNAALINNGDKAIIFKPYYTVYMPDLKLLGGSPLFERYDESNNWDLDTDRLEKTLSAIKNNKKKPKYILITNPNNPTGTVLSRKALVEIVSLANEHDILIVSDEIYDEIIYNNAKFTSITEIAKGIPYIIFNGASKDYDATGIRMGFMMIPENDSVSMQLREKMKDFADARLSPNLPAEYAFTEALNNQKEHKKAITKMVNQIKKRVNACTDELNKSEYIHAVRPNGAFYIFPKIDMDKLKIKDDREFVDKLLREEYIQITSGIGFGESNHVRVVALADEKTLIDVAQKMDKLCRKYKK